MENIILCVEGCGKVVSFGYFLDKKRASTREKQKSKALALTLWKNNMDMLLFSISISHTEGGLGERCRCSGVGEQLRRS